MLQLRICLVVMVVGGKGREHMNKWVDESSKSQGRASVEAGTCSSFCGMKEKIVIRGREHCQNPSAIDTRRLHVPFAPRVTFVLPTTHAEVALSQYK